MSEFVTHPVRTFQGGRHRKEFLILGIVGAGAAAYIFEKRRSAVKATTAAPDPNAVDPNAVDPNAGYGDYTPIPANLVGYNDPSTGAFIGGTGTTVLNPTTNAQWTQQAEATLVNDGYEPVSTAAILGKYLLGGTLTASEAQTVQAAIALVGYPPVNPPPIHVVASPSPPTTSAGATHLPAPHASIGNGPSKHVAVLHWTAVSGASGYHIFRNGSGAGFRPAGVTQALVSRPGMYTVSAVGVPRKSYTSPQSNSVRA